MNGRATFPSVCVSFQCTSEAVDVYRPTLSAERVMESGK